MAMRRALSGPVVAFREAMGVLRADPHPPPSHHSPTAVILNTPPPPPQARDTQELEARHSF